MDETDRQEKLTNGEDEISLIDLTGKLIKHRRLILVTTAFVAIVSILYAVGSLVLPPNVSYLPNVYKPQGSMSFVWDIFPDYYEEGEASYKDHKVHEGR